VGHDGALSIYRCERSILSSDGTPFTHCRQSAQFVLTRCWIKRDRFLAGDPSNPLRINRCDSRIQ
jgi:hypothetical protein